MHNDSEMRTTFQKVILILLLVMSVVFGVLTGVLRTQKRVLYTDMMMTVAQEGEETVYTGTRDKRTVTVRCREEGTTKIVDYSVDNHIHYLCRVEYPQGTVRTEHGFDIPRIRVLRDDKVLFDGGYNPDFSSSVARYYNLNGTVEPFISIRAEAYGSNGWSDHEVTAGNILFFAEGPGYTVRGSWKGYFITLLVAGLAAVGTAFPYALFYWRHRFSVKDPEPTEFYLASEKFGDILLTIVVFGLYMASLLSKVPL